MEGTNDAKRSSLSQNNNRVHGATAAIAGGDGGKTPDDSKTSQTAAGASMPRIFLNTTERDQICLHTPVAGARLQESAAAASSSCSLPNLAVTLDSPGGEGGVIGGVAVGKKAPSLHRPHRHHRHTTRLAQTTEAGGGGEGKRFHCSQVNVYCSPRVTRRGSATENDDADQLDNCNQRDAATKSGPESNRGNDGANEGANRRCLTSNDHCGGTLLPGGHGHLLRYGSSRSLDSFGSASHMSTCASSEFRYCSLDRLSLPESSSSFGGRLRRIYSNPEAPFCSLDLVDSGVGGVMSGSFRGGSGGESMLILRDSKSCSNLKDPKPIVNHLELENKLSKDAGGNLLSPPPLLDGAILKQFENSQGSPGFDDDLYAAEQGAFIEQGTWGTESSPSRERRIQEWLQSVTVSKSVEGYSLGPNSGKP